MKIHFRIFLSYVILAKTFKLHQVFFLFYYRKCANTLALPRMSIAMPKSIKILPSTMP